MGKLLFIAGYSGAGKTTLTGEALKKIPKLHYLTTVTTRPPRAGENDSFEYEFVDSKEYERRRSASKQWDHSKYAGNSYGADVELVNALLRQGGHVICNVAPDAKIIADMAQHYRTVPTLVWINTPKATANARIASDSERIGRNNIDRSDVLSVKNSAAAVFTPTDDSTKDASAFVSIVDRLITGDT